MRGMLNKLDSQKGFFAQLAGFFIVLAFSLLIGGAAKAALPGDAPTSIATSTLTTTSILLTWTDNSTDETDFLIASSTNGTTWGSTTTIHLASAGATTGATSTSITGLTANTRYWFRVAAAVSGASTSTYSTIGSGTYTLANAPSSVTATAGSSNVNVAWSGDATNYYIVHTNSNIPVNNSGWISVTSYNFTSGLACGNNSFQVKGRNGDATETAITSVNASVACGGTAGGGSVSDTPATPPVAPPIEVVAPATPVVLPAAPVATPVVEAPPAAPVVAPTETPVTEVTPAAPVAEAPAASIFSKPESKVRISNVQAISLQPGAKLQLTYEYQNDTMEKAAVRVVRQLVNSKGKVVKATTVSKTLDTDAVLRADVDESISKTLPPGEYTVKVKILNARGNVLDENSFGITVEKLKKKTFVMGEVASMSSDLAFDDASVAAIKSDVAIPVTLKLKYSYTNTTSQKQTIKMVREVLDADGNVKSTNSGKWIMVPGEKDSLNLNQPVASNLAVGSYTLRLRALDWKTKEVLAENGLNFTVEMK